MADIPTVVAVDSMLTVSDGMRLRGELEKLGKPLLAVLLTQSHPDHYGGLAQLVPDDETPIIAPRGVHYVTRRDDPVKEQILRPMYGDDWLAVMKNFLPTDELEFLMELSIEPVATKLGLLAPALAAA